MKRAPIVAWALAVLAAGWACKALLLGLRLADGGARSLLGGWGAIALGYDDVRFAAAFAAFAAAIALLGRRGPRLERAGRISVGVLYAAVTFWMAFNIPVARFLSTPTTYAFLHAAGGALADSFAAHATFANLGLPALLWVGALALPRRLARLSPSPRLLAGMAALALALMALGPLAVARTETLGLHRNAVMALAETTLARRRPGAELRSLLAGECRSAGGPQTPLPELAGLASGRNIVWVILESTGARALTTYGARTEAMPNLAALASQAVVFEEAYAAYPESIKGLFSTLCSRTPPPRMEAAEYAARKVPCRSIADLLRARGYRAGLFHSGWFAYLGMEAVVAGRGFVALEDAAKIESPHRSSFGVDDRATAERLLAFVDGIPRDERFFAVYMPIAGHHPYHAPGGLRPFPVRSDFDEYLNDLHTADQAFGVLRDGLRARGLDERTLYLVVGDHGEAFGAPLDHEGNVAHALFLHEENVRVPFFIAAPGALRAQRRAPQLASLLDLAPTTLALAGLPPAPEHEGQSLLTPSPRPVRFFTEQAVPRVGLRDGRWKLILDESSGRPQLFDLASDPRERHDLAPSHGPLVQRYRACLGR